MMHPCGVRCVTAALRSATPIMYIMSAHRAAGIPECACKQPKLPVAPTARRAIRRL